MPIYGDLESISVLAVDISGLVGIMIASRWGVLPLLEFTYVEARNFLRFFKVENLLL